MMGVFNFQSCLCHTGFYKFVHIFFYISVCPLCSRWLDYSKSKYSRKDCEEKNTFVISEAFGRC